MNSASSRNQRQAKNEHDPYIGAEPGVNPRSGASNQEYSHFKQSCVIDIIDYDSEEATFLRMGNDQFIHTMKELAASRTQSAEGSHGIEQGSPPFAVRWINIGGIDWNVLRAVALQYDLHSLALEDILHESGHNHSKADYYPEHLFVRILNHTLAPDYEDEDDENGDYSPNPLDQVPSMPSSHLPNLDNRDLPNPAAQDESPAYVQSLTSALDAAKDDTLQSSSGSISVPSLTNIQVLAKGLTPPEVASDKEEEEVEASRPVGGPDNKSKSRRRQLLSSAKHALSKRMTALSGYHSEARQEVIIRIRELKRDHRVNIRHQPIFIFLLRNGTVISIHPSPNLDYSAPITERLHQEESVLRTSNDASLLVQSLIDLSVDRVLEVMDEYQAKIHDLEHKILMNPSMETVRSLHILSGDLIMHRRTLEPIKTMIFGLRKYDLDRCIALSDNLELAKQQQQEFEEKRKRGKKAKRHEGRHHPSLGRVEAAVGLEPPHLDDAQHGSSANVKSDDDHLRHFMRMKASQGHLPTHSQGYFSYKAKVYLADVYDHMDFALTSLDMFAGISENLINYAFNMASYEMNIVMSRLTLVSIIFLPLTLLTGYFGMNFTPFWAVEKNSDALHRFGSDEPLCSFWKVAAPMMACLVPLFMFQEIKRLFTYLKRRWQDRQAMNLLLREIRKPNSQFWYDLQA
ncbi:hypothetical protein BKA70DRAFT_1099837 [Coprinopsis sp. MPI-PUGE-AT-0042]|nr:hypothetical protein BKA70DRAFT_1099837 [Coprinopsis sp. MPI-PUGE-AT-0042]